MKTKKVWVATILAYVTVLAAFMLAAFMLAACGDKGNGVTVDGFTDKTDTVLWGETYEFSETSVTDSNGNVHRITFEVKTQSGETVEVVAGGFNALDPDGYIAVCKVEISKEVILSRTITIRVVSPEIVTEDGTKIEEVLLSSVNEGDEVTLPAAKVVDAKTGETLSESPIVSVKYMGKDVTVENGKFVAWGGEYTFTYEGKVGEKTFRKAYEKEIARRAPAKNEVESFNSPAALADFNIGDVGGETEWMPEYKGEQGVIKWTFNNLVNNWPQIRFKPRRPMADYAEYDYISFRIYVGEQQNNVANWRFFNNWDNEADHVNQMPIGHENDVVKGEWCDYVFPIKHFLEGWRDDGNNDARAFLWSWYENKDTGAREVYFGDISVFNDTAPAKNEVLSFDTALSQGNLTAQEGKITWLNEFEGERGVIKWTSDGVEKDGWNKTWDTLTLEPRQKITDEFLKGSYYFKVKMYVEEGTCNKLSLIDSENDKYPFDPYHGNAAVDATFSIENGKWQTLYYPIATFKNGLEDKVAIPLQLGMENGGTIYFSDFSVCALPDGVRKDEIVSFDTQEQLALFTPESTKGASVEWIDEYKGEQGVVKYTYTQAGDSWQAGWDSCELRPRQSAEAYKAYGYDQLVVRVLVEKGTLNNVRIYSNSDGSASITQLNFEETIKKGEWAELILDASPFSSVLFTNDTWNYTWIQSLILDMGPESDSDKSCVLYIADISLRKSAGDLVVKYDNPYSITQFAALDGAGAWSFAKACWVNSETAPEGSDGAIRWSLDAAEGNESAWQNFNFAPSRSIEAYQDKGYTHIVFKVYLASGTVKIGGVEVSGKDEWQTVRLEFSKFTTNRTDGGAPYGPHISVERAEGGAEYLYISEIYCEKATE